MPAPITGVPCHSSTPKSLSKSSVSVYQGDELPAHPCLQALDVPLRCSRRERERLIARTKSSGDWRRRQQSSKSVDGPVQRSAPTVSKTETSNRSVASVRC